MEISQGNAAKNKFQIRKLNVDLSVIACRTNVKSRHPPANEINK